MANYVDRAGRTNKVILPLDELLLNDGYGQAARDQELRRLHVVAYRSEGAEVNKADEELM